MWLIMIVLVRLFFEDIEDYVRMKEDAFYLKRGRGDHENFCGYEMEQVCCDLKF